MHELSLCAALVEQVAEIAAREGATRVTRVVVQVGVLSGVEPDALVFAWPLATEGGVAEGAELAIEHDPFRLACRGCGQSSEPDDPFPVCPTCGSLDVVTEGGRGFVLRTLDLE